ncbi:MAG: ATP-binding protein [Spirochaetales bacterium]|nr:ATP-binding protein [Spirochaetales bacterium]
MIIDFSIRNYLSIKDEISLSFLANTKNIKDGVNIIPVDNGKFHLYSFSAIYGPNASGKSNIIKALSDLIGFIIFSHRFDIDKPIPAYKPFKLDTRSSKLPTFFEIEFMVENTRYIYSIEFNHKEILKEELNFFPEGRKANLFLRLKKDIKFGMYFTGEKKPLETFLLPNRLLLSLAANSNNKILHPVFRFFRDLINIHVKMDSSQNPFHSTTLELRDKKNDFKKLLFKILNAADLSVKDVKLIEDKDVALKLRMPKDIPDELKKSILEDFRYKPYLGHPVFDNNIETNKLEYFNLENEESTGTLKMYDIAGEVLNSLQKGTVLIIDEFNSGLHPLLNKFLVELFINKDINKKNAQLLISTHDTCVLDLSLLKREQIWFTDKTKYGVTELFSLDEYDKNIVRDYSKYSKLYLDGRFKAVPSINIKELIEGLF